MDDRRAAILLLLLLSDLDRTLLPLVDDDVAAAAGMDIDRSVAIVAAAAAVFEIAVEAEEVVAASPWRGSAWTSRLDGRNNIIRLRLLLGLLLDETLVFGAI